MTTPPIVETFPVGPLQCNCTILGDADAKEAIIIDPGEEIAFLYNRLTALGLKLKQILITHAHIDHIGGALKLKRLTGAPILLNENDLPLLKMMEVQAGWLGVETPEIETPDGSLDSTQSSNILSIGNSTPEILHTPGHTPGSVCLYFAPIHLLVAGDTLFAGSIGRTDLPGGNSKQILNSIRSRLMVLPEETKVIPGHGRMTTIGEEKHSNPFLV